MWLNDPRIAQLVQDKIVSGVESFDDLAAWVITANHVHLVVHPRIRLRKIMQKLKGSTGYAINRLLNLNGTIPGHRILPSLDSI